MKKTFLILVIVLAIFFAETTIVWAAPIDVGPGATDRASTTTTGTRVPQTNPANETGTLDTWELWFASDGSNVEVATFYVVSGNTLSTRDYETIGSVTSGSKQTITGIETEINAGDYVGAYWSSGSIEYSTGIGTPYWYLNSTDAIPCTNAGFNNTDPNLREISIYATGTSPDPTPTPTPEPNINFSGGINMTKGICAGDGSPCTFNCGEQWTFTYNGSEVTYGTVSSLGECWMDRNLGASGVATVYNDSNAYGDLFQWGREDDGHQIRSPAPDVVEGDMSLIAQPGHNDYITEQTSPNDWASNAWTTRWTTADDDPCPVGWRVPTEAEWSTEESNWAQQNRNGAFASPLKLTAAGNRTYSSGGLTSVGSDGTYWSSTNSGIYAKFLIFDSGGSSVNNTYRAIGASVRCIKD